MSKRALLREHLTTAWQQTVNKQYLDQTINSERGLQVHFCAALIKIFENEALKRRLFIEPNLRTATSESRFPDVVICNSKHVIGIVELKYVPRGRPDIAKDIATLEFAVLHGEKLTIANERFLGVHKDARAYPLASDAVLCWAGIYKGERVNIISRLSENVRPHFLQMNALTLPDADPNVCIGPNKA